MEIFHIQLSVRVDDYLIRKLELLAKEQGMTKSQYIRYLLEQAPTPKEDPNDFSSTQTYS